ncbi:MAG: DUF4384 domain-containing protein [Candidatus Thiodiazotropha sp. (ex Monitilora ramsayi)]|nr:DUF4384 domain-containing protein [Candidatus Thiodiazotropha sp. (ex Monitilora ramsayi)]
MFNNEIRQNIFKGIVCTAFIASTGLLSSCANLEEKQKIRETQATTEVRIVATPNAAPQRAITNFSTSLRCMDKLFLRYRISDLKIGTQDIPDRTEVVLAGTKDMLISALSQMSIESRAVKFVALGQDLEDITRFHSLHQLKNFTAPDFFIRGAITQVDRGVIEKQVSGGLAIAEAFSLSASKDNIASIITLDMNMGLVSNLQILPGITSSNSIAVARKGKGLDLSGTIKKLGAVFQVDFTESEGLHHAVRTLVELGVIELMGRLTQVPYWECLDIETTSTLVQSQIQDWYKSLAREDLTKFVQAKLYALGLYAGPVDGKSNAPLRTAITLFKKEQGQIADSRLDYMLYYSLITDSTPIDIRHRNHLAKTVQVDDIYAIYEDGHSETKVIRQHTGLEGGQVTPLELILTTEHGTRPVYRQGESVSLQAEISVNGHLYCFYQPGSGEIVKIFPNRYRPSSRIDAGSSIRIPGDDPFAIRLDQRQVTEKILCMASYKDIEERMPFELKEKSLQTISLAQLEKIYRRKVASLSDLYNIYKSSTDIVPLRRQIKFEIQ